MTLRVLFLAASPDDRAQLRLGDEVREVEQRLRAAAYREIAVISKWAVRPGDLQAALLQHEPHIVHFSGHGETEGIVVQDDQGSARIIPGRALARMFAVLRDSVRVVIFNACHSAEHARAVSEHVDVVVGMRAAMGDQAAVAFAAGFFMGLGYGRSVQQAFELGTTELAVQDLPDGDQPALMTRPGVQAAEIVLTGPQMNASKSPAGSSQVRQVSRAGHPPPGVAPHAGRERMVERIAAAEIPWTETLDEVARCIERDQPVVVLAGRKAGKSSFAGQLVRHLREHRPAWTVVRVSARPLGDERVDGYLARMRSAMAVDEPCERLVVCISGWSRRVERRVGVLDDRLQALGNELRARTEQTRDNRRFSMVAIGGYPLYLLRYVHGDLSALNHATERVLPEFTAEQVHGLMERCHPGFWSRADADQVHWRSGGHPWLVKALLSAWVRDPGRGWDGAEEALEDDRDFLLPTLAMAANDARVRRALARCLDSDDGIKARRTIPSKPGNYLLYTGLLRSDGRRLRFRCDAVRRLVGELFEEDEDDEE